jgi:cell wall-associated NlpC family hydrolase
MEIINKCKWGKISLIPMLVIMLLLCVMLSSCGEDDTYVTPTTGDIDEEDAGSDLAVEYIYGIPMNENAAVVLDSVADIYELQDVKSQRISQVLCNQPVSVISKDGAWAKVKTITGITGWIKSRYISDDVSSISGRLYIYKIVVTSREKTVYSGPSGGVTRVNAQMGTEFYAFSNMDDTYEVFLPGNSTGWLKGSGIIRLLPDEAIPVTNPEDFASTALRFKGTTFMLNGMSSMGIDSSSLVYICARINGINLPKAITAQVLSGVEIDTEDAKAGDLVFLSVSGGNEASDIATVGICIGDGSYIYAGRNTGYVAIGDMNKENADGVVVAARRVFN